MSWFSWCRIHLLGLALDSLAFSSGGPRTLSAIWRHPRRDVFKDVFRPWFRKAPENCFCARCSVCLYGLLKDRVHWNGLSTDMVCATSGSLWTLHWCGLCQHWQPFSCLFPTQGLYSAVGLCPIFKQRIGEVTKQRYQESDKCVMVTRLTLP